MTLCYCGDHSAISGRRNVVIVIKSRNCEKVERAVQCGNDICIAPRAATLGFCPIADASRLANRRRKGGNEQTNDNSFSDFMRKNNFCAEARAFKIANIGRCAMMV